MAQVRRVLLSGALDRYAAYTHVPVPEATAVVIYITAWCPYCKTLRERLTANAVPYTEYDVEKSLQGQIGFWALRARGVPVTVVGSKVVYGYRVREIEPALKALGHSLDTDTTDANRAADASGASSGSRLLEQPVR